MADRIRGITIEIGGDTTGLNNALKDVNSNIKSTQSQLKDVERLLKLDPSNTELLSQKQKLLADAVSETKDKLNTLKEAERQAQQQFAEGRISQEQYDGLKREIIATEQQLQSLEEQAGRSNVVLQQISVAGEKFQEFGQKAEAAGKALLPITAAVAGIGTAAVKTTADFDSSMSNVSAISGATGEDFEQLRDKAREMGAETKFSASEAADAMSYMAMAGWKTEDMLGGISGVMNLAAASGADLATTSDIVTDALTGMGYTAADAGRLADVMAAASSNANTNVEMMGETFKYVAPVCGALGYSMEDTALAVGLMANSGIKASQAGTQLRGALTNMVKPTDKMKYVMNELGIEISNEDGSMKSLDETMKILRESFAVTTEEQKAQRLATLEQKAVADGYGESLKGLTDEEKYFQLAMYAGQKQVENMSEVQFKKIAQDKLGIKVTKKTNKEQVAQNLALVLGTQAIEGLTQEQQSQYAATLFGKEAMSGMLAIINASEDDYNKLSEAIANSEGAAKHMSETMQDNLNGQLQILKSQLEEAAISIGDALMPKIRELVKKIQEWTDWFNQLDESQKQMVVTTGLIVAAIGPLLIVIGKVSIGIGAIMSAVTALGPILAGLSAAGGPIMLTAVALGAIAFAAHDAQQRTNEYYDEAVKLTNQEQLNQEKIDALYSSYELMNQRRNEAAASADAEALKEQALYSELQGITDENGNVKAGYEERVKYILGELSAALGQEYTMTGNQIDQYDKLGGSIDSLILKKQANALLDANAESYAEAITNRTNAFMEYYNAQKNVEEASKKLEEAQQREAALQEDLNTLRESGIMHMLGLSNESAYLETAVKNASETTNGYRDKLSELNNALLNAETAYVGYETVISNQEMLIEAKDNQALLADAVLLASNSFQTAETSTEASLQRQVQTFTEKYQAMKEAVDAGAPGITQTQVEQMKSLVDRSKAELDRLPDVMESTAKDAVNTVKNKKPEMENAGKDITEGVKNGVEDGTKDVVRSVEGLAKESIDEFKKGYKINSPSKVTWEIGKYISEGLKEGIKSGTEDIVGTVNELSDETISSAEYGMSQEVFSGIGKQITAGLTEGILSGKSQVLTSVRQMCTETINSARNQLGIHSPSTEFSYIGQMSGEGFIEGWNNTTTNICEAVTNSVGQAVTVAANTFGDFETTLLSLRDSSGNSIGTVVKNAEEAQEVLRGIQEKLGDTISGQIDMFSAFDGQAKTSTDELLNNMQSQVDGTEQWAENLRILAERGVDQGLLQKMAEMGPKGAGYVTTFTQMTNEELQRANALFTQAMTLPESTAASIMQSYQIAGTMTAQGFSNGIQENISAAEEAARQMADNAINAIRILLAIHSPSQVTMEAGQYFTEGFAEGIANGISRVGEAVTQMTTAATTTLDTQLQQSNTATQTYQASMSLSWTTWATGLVAAITTSLSNLGLGVNTQLLNMKTSFTTETTAITTDWTVKWTSIETKHKNTMKNIKELTTQVLSAIKTLSRSETTQMKTDSITTMNQTVVGIDEELKKLEPTVKSNFEPAVKYITDLIPKARIWGNDMIDGFIQGIRDKMDELEDACEDVADTVSDYLHFTRPEKGPLRCYEEWMPHMMQGLAKGLRDNRNLITEQIQNLTADMSALQMDGQTKQPVNLTSYNVIALDGKQVAETVNEQLGILL